MDGPRTRPVIALFGSSGGNSKQTLQRAESLGRAVSAYDAILLTGGTGPAEEPVKNRAIRGALTLDSGCWVGVDRTRGSLAEGGAEGRGYAIKSTLNHQRNYLEAWLADAAIALKGGEGTMSEITACLLEKRPVALVGGGWRNVFDLDDDRPKALATLTTAAVKTFKNRGAHALEGHLIEEATITEGLLNMGAYAYFESNEPAETILNWLTSKLRLGGPLPGSFPDIPGHDRVKAGYLTWLETVPPRTWSPPQDEPSRPTPPSGAPSPVESSPDP